MQNRNEASSGDQSSPRPNDNTNSGSHTPTQPPRRPASISTPIKSLMRNKYQSPNTPLSGDDKLIVQSSLTRWLNQSGVCSPHFLGANKDIVSKLSSLYINVSELYELFGIDFKLHDKQDVVFKDKQLHIAAIDYLIQKNEADLTEILGMTEENIKNAIIASTSVDASKQEIAKTFANLGPLVTAVKVFLDELTELNKAINPDSAYGEETPEKMIGENVQLASSSTSQTKRRFLKICLASVGGTVLGGFGYIYTPPEFQLPILYTLITGYVGVTAFHQRDRLGSRLKQAWNWCAQQTTKSDLETAQGQADSLSSSTVQQNAPSTAQPPANRGEPEAQETTNDRSGGEEVSPPGHSGNNV